MNTSTVDVEVMINPKKHRQRSGRRAAAPKQPVCIPRITRLMALAIKFEDMIRRGEVRDYADLARLGYVSRARLTQIMNLLLLAPDLQECLLSATPPFLLGERDLRAICAEVMWTEQRPCFQRTADRG